MVRADLDHHQVPGSSLQALQLEPARLHPPMDPLEKAGAQVCGSRVRNLLATINKLMPRRFVSETLPLPLQPTALSPQGLTDRSYST